VEGEGAEKAIRQGKVKKKYELIYNFRKFWAGLMGGHAGGGELLRYRSGHIALKDYSVGRGETKKKVQSRSTGRRVVWEKGIGGHALITVSELDFLSESPHRGEEKSMGTETGRGCRLFLGRKNSLAAKISNLTGGEEKRPSSMKYVN